MLSLSEGLEDALHGLLIFLLGLFLSDVISRWSNLTYSCLGGLTDAVHGQAVLAASLLPKCVEAQETLTRWGALSVALLFEATRGSTASEVAAKFLGVGLLSPDEAHTLLNPFVGGDQGDNAAANALVAAGPSPDPRVPWTWAASLWGSDATFQVASIFAFES